MPVSYLHPAIEGTRFWDRAPVSSSECGNLGELSLVNGVGDGDRAPKESRRACWDGVDGSELEWWATRCGRGMEGSRKSFRSSLFSMVKKCPCHRQLATFWSVEKTIPIESRCQRWRPLERAPIRDVLFVCDESKVGKGKRIWCLKRTWSCLCTSRKRMQIYPISYMR